jgi:pilus assembly protein CpaC
MFLCKRAKRNVFEIIMLAVLLFALPAGTWAANAGMPDVREPGKLKLVVGKSLVLRIEKPASRVSIADPGIADLTLISPHEIYITGKTPGVTNLTLWHKKDKISDVYDLEVSIDISRLKQRLHEVLPDERDLRVMATQDSVTLSGRISSASNLSEAMAVAGAYAPKGKVQNLVRVAGVQQVMLEVRVAEMSRTLIRRLGINFNYVRGQEFGVSTLGGLSQVVSPNNANIGTTDAHGTGSPVQFLVSPTVNALFRFSRGLTNWTGFIDAMKQDGLVKVLAEPTLIALSGKTAKFLAGGEFPVPVPQGLGTVAIDYKPFGVGLSFTPTVLSDKEISMKVAPEVSDLDYSTALQFQGFVVPGISTRKASTVVNLADGQSFAIAGLLQENVRDVLQKFPVLGDIPILGALFRSRAFQKNETELVIIATPHLVKPLDMEKQSLPTDYYREPDDEEFYVLGLMEGRAKGKPLPEGKLDGEFGHAVPKN